MNGTHGVLTNMGGEAKMSFTYAGEADVRVEGGALILARWKNGGSERETLGVWPLSALVSYTCEEIKT